MAGTLLAAIGGCLPAGAEGSAPAARPGAAAGTTVHLAQAAAGATATLPPRVFDPGLQAGEAGLPPRSIRFVTTDDFPPFNFADGGGTLIGYNVELARAICRGAGVACTIQALPFDELGAAVAENRADAIIAGLRRPDAPGELLFTRPYLVIPARFVAAAGAAITATPEGLAGLTVAVVAGSRHEAYLSDFFGDTTRVTAPDLAGALALLKEGKAAAVFADALPLTFWLNGPAAAGCCGFAGGPYIEPAYFDGGLAIAVSGEPLKVFLDGALMRLEQSGELGELSLTFFPAGLY
ncbi:transporter substrate-binding domain-containing protein [Methylobrevis albus]|uniref:Transporter substrate-binding domain-containing protein n=1 Tax=Methylobrevis albus TaxID=2793297 RepID=A0A931I3D5_9HYPH|nr:transporter substrate-binding domain-containing protein [Methylobrevis albus]MBH0238535.1 transporter substrate-binding domain-containing protein [Methylobrevis albus]